LIIACFFNKKSYSRIVEERDLSFLFLSINCFRYYFFFSPSFYRSLIVYRISLCREFTILSIIGLYELLSKDDSTFEATEPIRETWSSLVCYEVLASALGRSFPSPFSDILYAADLTCFRGPIKGKSTHELCNLSFRKYCSLDYLEV
jgi:hypothetical protein